MQDEKWKILKSETVLTTPFLTVKKDRCKTLRGNELDYYSVVRGDAAAVIALTKDKKILMQRQYRHPVREWFLQIPAGMIERGEDPQKAAQRELLEETGYQARTLIHIGTLFFTPGLLKQKAHIFVGFDAHKVQEPQLDPGEDVEFLLVPFDDVFNFIVRGEIKDIDTIAELCLAREYLSHVTVSHEDV